jgi:hypothetical protein
MSTTLVTKDYQDFIDTGSDITPILNRLFEAFVDIRSSGRYSIDLKAAPQDSTAWEYVIYNSASELWNGAWVSYLPGPTKAVGYGVGEIRQSRSLRCCYRK